MLSLALALMLNAAPAQLTIDVKPEGVEVKLDGKKLGNSGKPMVKQVTAGRHVVRLTYKGDSHEEEVSLKGGEKKTYAWEFSGNEGKRPASDDPIPTVE